MRYLLSSPLMIGVAVIVVCIAFAIREALR